MDEKTCKACHETKLETDFFRNRKNRDGFDVSCKACRASKSRIYKHPRDVKIVVDRLDVRKGARK